jgi:hypothetical protein
MNLRRHIVNVASAKDTVVRAEPAATTFPLVPPGDGSRIAVWLLCLVLPLTIAGIALGLALAGGPRPGVNLVAGSVPGTIALTLTLVLGITLPLAWWLHRSGQRLAVGLTHGTLDLRAAWYHQRIAVADLDMSKARVLRLSEHPELRPTIQTNGIGLPGFTAGHFRLRDWRTSAFCILTDRNRVVVLPERGGRVILLSLRQPQALIDALKSIAAAQPGHR